MPLHSTHLLICALAICFVGCAAQKAVPSKPIVQLPPIDQKSIGCVPVMKNPERHNGFMNDKEALLKTGPIQLVFLGDSITDAWRRDMQFEIYKKAFGKYNPFNTGISGDETQHLLWRIDHGELDGISPKVATIMIGTNNLGNSHQTPAQTIDGVRSVVTAVESKLPNTKILLLAVFPRGEKIDNPFRAKIAEVNATLAQLPLIDNQVMYLDIGPKFLTDDGTLPRFIMPDSLHPNVIGYQIWADAVSPVIDTLEK